MKNTNEKIVAIVSTSEIEYEFVLTEVLSCAEKQVQRKDTLYLAMVLGNNYGKKVQMLTLTTQGQVELHGVVLAMSAEIVFLKGGAQIPIVAIVEVKIY